MIGVLSVVKNRTPTRAPFRFAGMFSFGCAITFPFASWKMAFLSGPTVTRAASTSLPAWVRRSGLLLGLTAAGRTSMMLPFRAITAEKPFGPGFAGRTLTILSALSCAVALDGKIV